MTYLIVGCSAGLGRAIAERFARGGHALVLVSSDDRDTAALASDLKLRHGIAAVSACCDLAGADLDLGEIDRAMQGLPPLAGLIMVAGMNLPDDVPGQSPDAFDLLTRVNYTAPCAVIGHFLPVLRASPGALIVGIGSVAAARGRQRNAAYGAAKRALASFFESLRHSTRASGVLVQYYVAGYLDTNLAFSEKLSLAPASPRSLADRIYDRRHEDFGVSYFPRYWRPICAVLRLLPWVVFRRLSF